MSVARWGFITLGVAIPLSTALDNFLLLAILAVLIGDGRAVWQTVTQNPVARACVLLFGALLIGARGLQSRTSFCGCHRVNFDAASRWVRDAGTGHKT